MPKTIDAPTSMTTVPNRTDENEGIVHLKESDYKGKWRSKQDGYLYKHAVAANDPRGKTHKAIVPAQKNEAGDVIHTGLFWEGNEEEFTANFTKE